MSQTADVMDEIGGQLDRDQGPHLYRQISRLVREQVESGRLQPGQSLPPQRELSMRWGIGEVTVRRALQALAAEGLLEARPGSGTVVRPIAGGRGDRVHPAGTLTLGVAFTDLSDGYPFFRPVLAGLRAEGCDVAIRLFDMPAREGAGDALAHVPPLSDLDGLVMMSPVNLALLALTQRQRLPTVLLFSDVSDGFSHCIMPDYTSGVIAAVRRLTRAGRKRIALVTAGPERFSTGRWLEAYRAALQAYRLPTDPDWIVTCGYTERDGAEATRRLLHLDRRPQAILYASDFMARGGLLAAHELGVSVPQELAVVGAGPVLEEGGWTVSLATIDLGLFEMGRLTRQAIAAAVDPRTASPLRQAVASTFREGHTA